MSEKKKIRIDEWLADMNRGASTQGRAKLLRDFSDLTETSGFRAWVIEMRRKLDIPTNGFQHTEDDIMVSPRFVFHINKDQAGYLDKEIRAVCKKNNLHFLYWGDQIELILFYGSYNDELVEGFDLCITADLRKDREELSKEISDANDEYFPIAIRISPHATERDIIDYVKKTYKTQILPAQLDYRKKSIRIGRTRKKNAKIRERNGFIYRNRHLSRKELVGLVSSTFGEVLDYSYIGKIISLENKRRR